MSEPTTTEPAGSPNPLRMLLLGVVSLFLGAGATPAALCVLYPMVTTAQFGDKVNVDTTGAFVVQRASGAIK